MLVYVALGGLLLAADRIAHAVRNGAARRKRERGLVATSTPNWRQPSN